MGNEIEELMYDNNEKLKIENGKLKRGKRETGDGRRGCETGKMRK